MKNRFVSFLRLCLLFVLVAGVVFQPQYSVYAAASLSVTPLTWNVVGLDSNNVNVGPNHFPVGARVCNTSLTDTATNVKSAFVFDDGLDLYTGNNYINLRAGTLSAYTSDGINLAPGACTDFYYEVEVTRNPGAYNQTRRYHITASSDGGTVTGSTPIPREIFVEHLVSQNRNAVTDVQLDGVSIAPGGTMTLLVGETYEIKLVGYTATQGYEQIEYFINFPNTIFQITSVSSTFTADTSPTVGPSPINQLYGDNCAWENNPNSPNYRACKGVGKTGGNITVTYQVKILQVPAAPLVNPEPLSTLIYDFSGSSYHYNSDYGVSTRFAFILDPSTLTIAKNFSPDPTSAGGISTLTFTLTNPNAVSVSGLNFTDTLPTTPGTMTIASPTNASTSGCGTPTFTPVAGAGSLSFLNGTIAANSVCTISVNVTVPVAGTYTNTTSNLFINALNTGNNASDPLTVTSTPPAPTPVCGLTMAQWTFAGFTVNPPPFPAANTQASNVTTAAISVGNGLTAEADTTAAGGNPQPGIRLYGWQNAGPIVTATSAFIQFAIDTSKYTQVNLQFDAQRKANGPSNDELYYSTNGTTWTLKNTFASTTSWATYGAYDFTGQTNTTGITYFRIYGYGANATSSGNDFNLDNVTFTGCATPVPPTITKAFLPNPIAVNGISTLTFTLTNSNSIALTGVTFTDSLPTGLQVAATPTAVTTCGGTPTWAPAAAATTLTFGSPTGATIPASSSCTLSVNITGTASGSYQNVSGFISSTNGGTNTGSTGSGTAPLTVLQPPVISKLFAPNPILVNGTSTLTFTISNPNLNNALTGVAFADTFPTTPGQMRVAATPNASTTSCGAPTFAPVANATSITFAGGTVAAGGTCTITVDITAPATGSYPNTSGAVSSTNGGTGNTASDTLTVNAPNPAIALLKQISTNPTGPWASYITVAPGTNVYYQFTIENIGDVPLSPVSVTDPTISTAGCTWPVTLPVADINDNDHIATCVVGPIVASTGSHTNTARASGTFGGTQYMSDPASSATYSTPELTLVKSVAETSFTALNDTLNYSYLVTNSGFAPLLGPVTVTDNKATVTCPAVTTVGDLDDWLDPGESVTCTAIYTITFGDMTAALVTNTATASADGVTSNTDSETVYRSLADLIVTKTNDVGGVLVLGNSFTWTITVNNTGIAVGTFLTGNVILSDTLPGLAGYYLPATVTVTNGGIAPIGTINCSITGTALSCVAGALGVTMPVNSSFSVAFSVTPTADGSLLNTATVDPGGNVLEISEANNTDSDTVTVVAPPSIAKSFSPNPTAAGVNSTLTFTITNPNAGTDLTGVAFSDTYPLGLVNATPLATTNTCGGTLTAVAAGGSISLVGGAITVNDVSCTITVSVVAATGGTYANTTGTVTSTNGGTGNTASATLNVVSVVKTIVSTSESSTGFVSGFERVAIGEIIRYRLTTLLPEGTWTNVQITDAIDTGIQFLNDGTATLSYSCDGVCSNSTFIITPGTFSSSTDPTFSLGTVTNPDADVNSEFLVVEFNALVLNMASNAAGGVTRNNSYTISFNGTPITSPSVGVRVVEPSITDLAKTVSPAVGPYYPGDTITYTLTYSNGSTGVNRATAFDVFVTDTLNANLDLQSVSIVAPTGSVITDTSTLGAGGVVQVLVDRVAPAVDIASGPTGVTISIVAQVMNIVPSGILSNTANLTYTSLPGGVTTGDSNGTCPNVTGSCTPGTSGATTGERNGTGVAPNTYTDVNTVNITITPSADVAITKTDGVTNVNAGDTTTYTIRVTNIGPSGASLVILGDPAAAGLTKTTVLCSATPGRCLTPPTVTELESNTFTLPDLGSGQFYEITVTATVTSGSGSVTNTASVYVNSPGMFDPDTTNNTASDTDTVNPIADLAITKTDGVGVVTAGGTTTYTIVVTNNGPSVVTGATITDSFPLGITAASWTCVASAGSACNAANGIGDIATTADLLVNGTVTFTVTANISTAATGFLINAATVNTPPGTTDPTSGNNTATDTDAVAQVADLGVIKTDGTFSYTPGTITTYTIVVSNAGPSAVTGANFVDTFPTDITSASWTCAGAGSATCPAASGSGNINALVDLPVDGSLTYTVIANINSAATGNLINTATITTPNGTTDPTPGNNSDTDLDEYMPIADLAIVKTDGSTTYIPGGTVTYTVTVTNNGPSDVFGATVADIKPAQITTWDWACTSQTGNASGCTPVVSSSSDFTDTVDIPSGESIVYTVTANTDPVNVQSNLVNTATVAVPIDTTDPTSGNNSSTDLDEPDPQSELSITKTDGVTAVTPGGTTTYTIVVTNSGPSAVTDAAITDTFPLDITSASWTCVANAGSACGTANGTGNIATTADLLVNGTVTFTVIANVSAAATGNLVNTATVGTPVGTTDPTLGNNTATDTDTVNPVADLSLTKTVNNATPNVGDAVTFTITVSNAGPSDATNVAVSDALPAGLSFVSATPSQGTYVSGTGVWTVGTINNAANATLTITATVTTAGAKTNTAQVSASDQFDPDSTPNNGVGTEDDQASAIVTPQSADLSLTKTVNNATPNMGDAVTFTITVSNAGPSDATNVAVSDALPAGLSFVSATPSQGTYVSGTGVWTVGTINNATNATLTITATVTTIGAKTNTAQVSASDQSDPDSIPNNNNAGEDDQASVTVTPGAVIDLSLDKQVSNATPNVGDIVTFTLVIANAGPSTATSVVVTDVLPSGYTYVALSIAGGDTRNDTNPSTTGLTWTINSLASGVSVNLTYQATVLASGTYDNYAEIASHTETDSDSTPGDGSTTDDDDDTEIVAVTIIVDPALSKAGNPTQASVGETVTFTLTVTNNGNAPAPNVVITDALPAMFDVTAVNVSGVGVPFGTSVNVTPAIGVGPAPYTVVVTLGGDLDVTDVVVIDIVTTVNGLGNPPINNTASLTTSNQLNNLLSNDSDSVTITIRTPSLAVSSLPSTGFAPNVETEVFPQPKDLAYADTDLLVEIPSLGVKIPIVGIQKKNGAWDVSWLGKQAGWLTGTAFPSWSGNSVLTSHVYLSNGLPGPFVNLNKLKYGDKIIVHAYGQKYTFEVRTNQVVEPNDTSAFKHEERSWLTLITCKEYDEKTNTYKKRVVVRAVLVSVADE